jgi:hypothetical protein
MKSLAAFAATILGISLLGGPLTLYLTRIHPKKKFGFLVHLIFVTLLGSLSILMGLILITAKISIVVALVGIIGIATGGLGITRIYRRIKN